MENLDLNAYGVTEMNHQEMVETDGGIVSFLYELITGRNLAQDVRTVVGEAVKATAQVKAEGGKTMEDFGMK